MTDINTTNPIERDDLLEKLQYKVVVPANLASLTSDTSYCESCFAGQQFSERLQMFMLDYAIKVSSKRPQTDR